MNNNGIDTQLISSSKSIERRYAYSSPKVIVYGDVRDLTKANGVKLPTDSETTVGGKISP